MEYLKELFEKRPLYQKILLSDSAVSLREWANLPAISADCLVCKRENTFNVIRINFQAISSFQQIPPVPKRYLADGSTFFIQYICRMCNQFQKEYLVLINTEEYNEEIEEGEFVKFERIFVQKIGQYPAVLTNIEKAMDQYLDIKSKKIYQKGVTCESQGYGIGAFAYYRQVIENQIDSLLDGILEFSEENKKEDFKAKIDMAKLQDDTSSKIDIVKDFLPVQLMPGGNNVLKIMYSALSEGLHNRSDEECLEQSRSLRTCLVFLVKKISEHSLDEHQFNEARKKLYKSQESKAVKGHRGK